MSRAMILTATAVALSATACADVDVANPNQPAGLDILRTPAAVEAAIAGAYETWYNGVHSQFNMPGVANAAFESATTSCRMGNSWIPRAPIANDPADQTYENQVLRTWQRSYRALGAVADGFRALERYDDVAAAIDAESPGGVHRLRAFGTTIQALGHATLAVVYDQAAVLDETSDREGQVLLPYDQVMDSAYAYFDEAIALAEAEDFTIPADWLTVEVTSDRLVEILHAWRAIFRASLPRWSDEPVDWRAVLDDLDRGLTSTFAMEPNYEETGFYNGAFDISAGPNGWGHETYFVIGMADQSGSYQRWLSMPVEDRVPVFDEGWRAWDEDPEDPFLIVTPDTRFPRGSTLEEQESQPGEYYVIPTADTWGYTVRQHFSNPARQTWRWSYYYYPASWNYWHGLEFTVPMITTAELDLLRAEALLETGDAPGAAAIVSDYRTLHGLSATDENGTNDDCVPRLPDDSCGGLMEMLKWEKRLEVETVGLFNSGWFWDGRRWGDLYAGTPLQWPVPAGDLRAGDPDLDPYTFGGLQDSPPGASSGSGYRWPDEPHAHMAPILGGC